MIRALGFILALFVAASVSAQDMPILTGMAPEGSPVRPQYDDLLENLDELSDGRLQVEAFLSGELGPEESYFSSMRRGRVQFAAVSAYAIGQAVPEYALLRIPFLFESFEEFAFVYDTYLKGAYAPLLAEKNMVELRWIANGFENIYGGAAYTHPDDVKGVRIRVPADPNAARIFQSAGADVIQVPFTDVIQSLQTGLIEGGESTTLYFLLGQFDAEAKHLTRTRHGFSTGALLVNKRWFDQQPEEDQAIYRQIYMPSEAAYRDVTGVRDRLLDQAQAEGLQVHDLTPEERAAWVAATASARAEIIASIGGQAARFMALIEKGKAEFVGKSLR